MAAEAGTKQDVLRRLREHGREIRALGVERLGLFGSFVRGEQGPDSDVDLLVRFRPEKKSFDSFMELASLLEDVLRRRVELVTTEGLSPYIGPQILKEAQDVPLGSEFTQAMAEGSWYVSFISEAGTEDLRDNAIPSSQ